MGVFMSPSEGFAPGTLESPHGIQARGRNDFFLCFKAIDDLGNDDVENRPRETPGLK